MKTYARTESPSWGTPRRLSRRGRRAVAVLSALLAVGLVISIITSASPWASSMLIRAVFEKGGQDTVEEMLPYVPPSGIAETLDVQYGDGTAGAATTLDAFRPDSANGPLPTVVWIHGGAWISGDKSNVAPYLKILAAQGYTTIGLNYSVGPESIYPTAVVQLNGALGYIDEHASELGVDAEQIVLAGDSAGSQLASELAGITTNPAYAELIGIDPALSPTQLVGTILNCGVFDMQRMSELNGIEAWGLKISLWAYTGTKDWSDTSAGATMSSLQFVTPEFPPTYISGGNGDALTWVESVPMSNILKAAGVEVDELFWKADHEPALPHEYQFHLDYDEAHTALQRTFTFLEAHTGAS
jgi:acetyl esterase/lipase